MSIIAPIEVPEDPTAHRQRADVQRHWRKRGWLPPTEYRRDFTQSCRPAIYGDMVRLEMAKVL